MQNNGHNQLTMLPQYSKQDQIRDGGLEDGPNEPLLGRTSTETAPPTYPPAGPSTAQGRHNVEYSYFPLYPREGTTEHAVGVLGSTKQETIQIVQRGIKRLSTIDPDRLIFKISSGTGESQHWATVMDEAWERFDANPPERLAVVVSDLPGDADLRRRHNLLVGLGVFLSLATVGVVIYLFVQYMAGTSEKAE